MSLRGSSPRLSAIWAHGGTGRHAGLRGQWGESSMRVRIPLCSGVQCLVPPRGVHWTCENTRQKLNGRTCGCGEIGKRSRLKICRISILAGSSPATRTIKCRRTRIGSRERSQKSLAQCSCGFESRRRYQMRAHPDWP